MARLQWRGKALAGDNATFEQGIRKAISAPFRTAIFLMIASLVIVVGRMLIDFAYTGSDPESLAAAREALREEIIAADQLPHVFGSPTERALRWALAAYELVYVTTGLDRSLVATPADFTEPEKALRRGVEAAAAQPHWQAVMIGTQLMAVRAAVLPALIPTLVLAWCLAFMDGAVARWIRRACGGRESSTIYHRAKYLHVLLGTLLLVVWFWSPVRLELWQLGLSFVVLGTLLLRIQLKFYKKYI